MNPRRHRDTYSRIVSTLALVLGLGTSGAYAADRITAKDIAPDAVTSKAVRNGTLTAADLADGSVSTGKLRDGSVKRRDLAAGALPLGRLNSDGALGDPPPDPGPASSTTSLKLAKPTRVLVAMTAQLNVLCQSSATTCIFRFGTYVATGGEERIGIAKSGDTASAAGGLQVDKAFTRFTVIDLPAGDHRFSFGLTRTSPNGSISIGQLQILVLELGNPPGSSIS